MERQDNGDGGGSNSRRAWPSTRGVAHGFRNFCITSDHPDGIIYCDANPGNTHTPRFEVEQTQPAASVETDDNLVLLSSNSRTPPQPPLSPCSSIISCSPVPSPGLSIVSQVGTITLSSSTDEEDEDYVRIKAELEKKWKAKDEKELQREGKANNEQALKSKHKDGNPIPSTSSMASKNFQGANDNQDVVAEARTIATSQSPAAGNNIAAPSLNDDDIIPFVNHKKFHYKTRIPSTSSTVQDGAGVSSATLGASAVDTGKKLYRTLTSGAVKQVDAPVGSVDDLKLSPYITREQAEGRLRALGDLEETQREIDSFAAIIKTGEMFRMQVGEDACQRNEPDKMADTTAKQDEGEQCLPRMQSSSTTTVIDGAVAVSHNTTSIYLGSGGNVVSLYNSPATEYGTDETMSDFKSGGYFQVTSPGQASTSDDYEWISD